jgi:hypothetical protein
MNPALIIVLIVIVVIVIVIASIGAAARERERLAALANWASANGFSFQQNDPFNLDARFNGLANIGRGHARYAYEVMSRNDPVPTWLFRYQYRTWETRTVTDSNGHTHTETYEQTHYCSYLIIELGAAFPKLFIRPENFFDKMKSFVGFDDINFESEEFSRKFFCKSDNREFAYAVIHPQMMEWLLSVCHGGERFEGQLGDGLFVSDITRMHEQPPAKAAALAMAAGFINRIPPFVWQDYGKRAAVQIPEAQAPAPPAPSQTAGSLAQAGR